MFDRSLRFASNGFASSVAPFAAALLLSPVSTAQSGGVPIWTVDDDGGAGTDFVDLQQAIDAASDGDVLLVRPGLYDGFEIAGKGVSVLADVEGTVVCLGGALVRNVPANSTVALRGIRTVADTTPGLFVRNCDGTVWIEACDARGADGDGALGSPTFHPDGYEGLLVIDGGNVVLTRTTFTGGDGAQLVGTFSIAGDGGAGISSTKSELAIYGCFTWGGDGGDAATGSAPADGGDGGNGFTIDAGSATAAGSVFLGGDGGDAGALVVDTTTTCGTAGDGGDGIQQPQPPASAAEVRVLDCHFSPGIGGAAFLPANCNGGAFGAPTKVSFGAIDGLAGPSFHHQATSPVRLGDEIEFAIVGEPGAIAVLALANGPGLVWDPAFNGTILVDANVFLTYPGIVALDGTLTYSWKGGLALQPGHALSFFAQPVFFVPSTLEFSAGSGSWLTVIDPAL